MKKGVARKRTELAVLAGCIIPALRVLKKNDPLRMAGATAFFTTFALPPIVFILAKLFGLLLTPKAVGRGLIENISNSIGDEGAGQVRAVIKSIRGFSNSWYVVVFGFLFLVFVATTLFIVIKNSLNQIWQVTIKRNPGLAFNFLSRLRSFAVILLVGILFLANLFLKSVETIGAGYLENFSRNGGIYFKLIFSELSSILIVTAWFTLVFRFLADGMPKWKAALAGGICAGLLFSGGRFILRALLVNSNIGDLYGPSGSFVLILLFVFYTSFILYFGACFIAVYSERKSWKLQKDSPLSGAVVDAA